MEEGGIPPAGWGGGKIAVACIELHALSRFMFETISNNNIKIHIYEDTSEDKPTFSYNLQ